MGMMDRIVKAAGGDLIPAMETTLTLLQQADGRLAEVQANTRCLADVATWLLAIGDHLKAVSQQLQQLNTGFADMQAELSAMRRDAPAPAPRLTHNGAGDHPL
jgi:hypothetical protein